MNGCTRSTSWRSASTLRRGKLLALCWTEGDMNAGVLEVSQSLQRIGGELRFVRPKTEDSERTVPLPEIC